MNKHIGTLARWRMQIFAITWLAYAAFYFTRKAFSVAKLGIAEDPTFMLDKMAMANLDAIYLAAYAIGQFTWGMLADRFGPRVVVLGGLLISAAAALVMGSFATLPIFATCMLIQGLAQSTGWSGLCKNLGSFFPAQQRGRVLGLWSSCYAFGGLVASPFAGWWAYTLIGTWHAAFISSAVVVAVVAVLFFIFQRNKPEDVGLPAVEPEPVLSAEETEANSKLSVWEPLKEILRNRTVLVLGLAYFMLKPARYAILLWGPVIVFEQMPSVGKVGAAIIPTSFELAGLLGPIMIGLASDKLFGARRMPACVLSLLALTVTLALFMGALHTGSVAGGGAAVCHGPDPVRPRLDDQRRGRHRLRQGQGRRHCRRIRQRLRLGRCGPWRVAAGLFRLGDGVHRVCRVRAVLGAGADPALEQPPGRRDGAACVHSQLPAEDQTPAFLNPLCLAACCGVRGRLCRGHLTGDIP